MLKRSVEELLSSPLFESDNFREEGFLNLSASSLKDEAYPSPRLMTFDRDQQEYNG
jgi:hypothetical protein